MITPYEDLIDAIEVRDERLELDCEALRTWRESEDKGKFRSGLRVARMNTYYGGQVIERVASECGYSDKTLYMRRDVAVFMCQIAPIMLPDGNIFSVRRLFAEHPAITYTHYRMALPRENFDIEQAIESLLAITDGDQKFEEWLKKQEDRPLILPMTSRQFGQYVTWIRGGKLRPKPIYERRGTVLDVIRDAWEEMQYWQRRNGNKEVKITIKDARQ